jgi:hypothetical protein
MVSRSQDLNVKLVQALKVDSPEYIYLRTVYGTTVRLKKTKIIKFIDTLRHMKAARASGHTNQPFSYKRIIMQAPEYALIIPAIAEQYPDLINDEVLDYFDECSQHIEDAAIYLLSEAYKKKSATKEVQQKPLNISDAE